MDLLKLVTYFSWIVCSMRINAAKYKIYKVDCALVNPSVIHNLSCSFQNHETGGDEVYTYSDIIGKVDKMIVTVQVFRRRNWDFVGFPFRASVDACKVMEGNNSNVIDQLFYSIASKITNCNHSCPYQGYFIINHIRLDLSWIPFRIPYGSYRLDVTFATGRRTSDVLVIDRVFGSILD